MIRPNTTAEINSEELELENYLNQPLLPLIRLYLKKDGQFLVEVFGFTLALMTKLMKVNVISVMEFPVVLFNQIT